MARAATPLLEHITFVAWELNRLGWAEANAGNLSWRLDPDPDGAAGGEESPLDPPVPELGSQRLLVSGTGTRMRQLASDPLAGLCLVSLNPAGDGFRASGPVAPTSELGAHLAGHARLLACRPADRALLHTHPTHLVALTLLYPEPGSLLALLARMHTEAATLGRDIAVVTALPPGSRQLADATGRALAEHRGVVWSRHGMVASGPDFESCLDLIQLGDRAAEIALLTGCTPRPAPPAGHAPGRGKSLQGRPAPDGLETFYDVRSLDSGLTRAELAQLPRRPIRLVLDNLRSAFNVGSIFRLADAARIDQVLTCGYTPSPPHHKLEQAALGATGSVPWQHCATTLAAVERLKQEGVRIVALETAEGAVPYHRFRPDFPLALVLGNEALGVSQPVLQACDAVVSIPVFGLKNSVNVAAAAAIVLYRLLESGGWLDPGPSAGR